jgi:threonyl-tRNA synthetase
MENQQMNEELSPEQLEARRDEMKQFYEKSLPYLEAQAKYEKLLTEVEQARYQRATMQINYASMMSAAQGPDLEDEDEREDLQPHAVPTPQPVAQAPAGGKKLRKG